jgi:hypothetical protein
MSSPRLELVGFSRPESKGSANGESGWWCSIIFSVSLFLHYRELSISAMIFVVSLSLPMWRLGLFWQQSPAAPYWRSYAAEGMKSAITNVSYAASRKLF